MSINFPNSPAPNDIYTYNGNSWLWDGESWLSLGSASAVGPQGPQGPSGPSGSGSTGPQGPTGPAAPIGPSGPEGPQGPAGSSITGPTGPSGPSGTGGGSGPQGPQGSIGPQGPQGVTGPQGSIGPQGPQGPSGARGPQGPQGPQGPSGPSGANANAVISAPTGTILFANASSSANGSNNFFFNVSTIRLGIGTNTPNSNIVVAGNAWITTGMNAASINISSTANIATGLFQTANIENANVSANLYVGQSIITGGTPGNISNVNIVFANTYYTTANIQVNNYNFDSSRANVGISSGSTINISNFSGMVIVNNWNTGGLQMWLVGGGAIGNVSNTLDLAISNTGTFSFSAPNYVWTCAQTATYTLTTIRTKDAV